jgi:hypothetical protein
VYLLNLLILVCETVIKLEEEEGEMSLEKDIFKIQLENNRVKAEDDFHTLVTFHSEIDDHDLIYDVDERNDFKIEDTKKLKKESAPQKENLKTSLSCKICNKELADKQTLKVLFPKFNLQESYYFPFKLNS